MPNEPACARQGCGHTPGSHDPYVGCLECACPCYMLAIPDDSISVPVLPYGGTSGHAPAPSSRDAIVAQDKDGRTGTQQETVLTWLAAARVTGHTWRDLDGGLGWGHGTISRILSDLHKADEVARLTERRDRCAVYVLREYVNGRETETQGRPAKDRLTADERAEVESVRTYPNASPEALRLVDLLDRLAPPA